jgi:aryl-alcohol dehydrogenase-like predicted oxidoreductase
MDYSHLAGTDLRVSRIALGCETLSGVDWGQFDEAQVFKAVARGLELGINVFDTADVYGPGYSETRLSQVLGPRRHDVVIITKFGVNWIDNSAGGRVKTFFDASPRHVVEALENSLRRLRIDCIPIYLVHWPDPNTPLVDTLEALRRCQAAGKIRYVGLSNFSAAAIQQAHSLLPMAVVQAQYSLLDRHVEQEILPCCRELGINFLAYGALAQGLLSGKYDLASKFDANDRRRRLNHFQVENLTRHLPVVQHARIVGERYQCSPSQVAIRWALNAPGVSAVIVGSKTPQQVEDNVNALNFQLDTAEWNELTAV